MNNTNCEKCVFSDYYNSPEPCAMGIIEQIKDSKGLLTNDQKFYSIINYRCSYAFSMDVYQQHKEQIGSIEDLKRQLYLKAQTIYYLAIFLDDTDISVISKTILTLPVKPSFVSLITYQKNNTQNIIQTFKTLEENGIQWKLHNMLEDFDYQDSLSIVFDTNTAKNKCQFLWVNSASSYNSWSRDIANINEILIVKQPVAHGMYRTEDSTDGLFMSFKAYDEIRHSVNMDIALALKEIENPLIKYYA